MEYFLSRNQLNISRLLSRFPNPRTLRASLHEPGLDTDPGQFSVEYYVYMSPGWVRVGSFSADPGQFPFAGLKGLLTTCQ